ncbi:MAG: hypothetical protein K2W80_01745 [Burkholderiales bacterium]|nr:hypothetical protein [Burkholderiales bacterium]
MYDADEQHDACLCLVEEIARNPHELLASRLIGKLAGAMKTRVPTVVAQLDRQPKKLASHVQTRALALLDEGCWHYLFRVYLTRRRLALLTGFIEALGLTHDGEGGIESDFPVPAPETVSAAVESLLRNHPQRDVARYLSVLVRHGPRWAFVTAERDRLLAATNEGVVSSEASSVAQAEVSAAATIEFSVLDRVLIEQVVRTAMVIQGCLHPEQVAELVESVIRLNEKWQRGCFHLGFMDVLLPGRTLTFDRPGDNGVRRGWYLAGIIAGLVRGNDLDGLQKVLTDRADDLTAALAEAGGPGASIARTAFWHIAATGRVTDAVSVIRGQAGHLGLSFATEALEVATGFIRQARFEQAKVIVDQLGKVVFRLEDETELAAFQLGLARRRGQCLQAAGDFDGAERAYRELLTAGEERNSPDLLADLGLVKGRFRALDEVRLPDGRDGRVAMRESLARGESYFRKAADQFGLASPKAAYPLALLGYLRWTFAGTKEREDMRVTAAGLASNAVSAILASAHSGVYRALGALGQSQFMLAATRMSGFEDTEAREGLSAWRTITAEAGLLPAEDVGRLLQEADKFGPAFADPIAEAVWDHRPEDAFRILQDGPWMTRSLRLRAALKAKAQSEIEPRAERLRCWMLLVPLLLRGGDVPGAEEGLGELDQLADDPAQVELVLAFLRDRLHYDPAWKESEASLARVYLLRRIGRDADAVDELRRLFYLVRDVNRWEAEQILTMFDDWALDPTVRDDLRRGLPRVEAEDPPAVVERLCAGERVSVVFIGGNELQAQYDGAVRAAIVGEWPGVSVHFEHTGWSSNWGRELGRLIELANGSDAVVLMPLMRTTLGRRVREALTRPWLSCTSTGKTGMLSSVRSAARLAVRLRSAG